MPETREQIIARHNRELEEHNHRTAGVEYHIVVRGPAGAEGQIDSHMQGQRRPGSGYTYVETRRA